MKIDATASLRLWAVTVDLGGERYRIPPRPAAAWLAAIGATNLSRIIPGMLEDVDAGEDLLDRILAGEVRAAEWQDAAHDAIATVTGMKWWTASRLTYYLLSSWSTLGGAVLSRGLDPAVAPVGAVLTLTYRILLENCKDESERRKLDLELDKPPTGIPISEMYDAQQAASNFMSLADAPG
jgi:hypothetical protein